MSHSANLNLEVLSERLAICRLPADAPLPNWVSGSHFWAIVRTSDELSIVSSELTVPKEVIQVPGWRAFKVMGPLDFSIVGILESIAYPLVEANISMFAISTFDTDYILVKESALEQATKVLRQAGFKIQ